MLITKQQTKQLDRIVSEFLKSQHQLLLVSMPPRSGKTHYFLNKVAEIIRANKKKTKALILKSHIPILEYACPSLHKLRKKHEIKLECPFSSLTGMQFDIILSDSVGENAYSDKRKHKELFDYFKSVVFLRLNLNSKMIVVCTRNCKGDLFDLLLSDNTPKIAVNFPTALSAKASEIAKTIGYEKFNTMYNGMPAK